jgi:glycosyltransferase involved in cell wall biosynthesis
MSRSRVHVAVPRYLPHLGGVENHVAAMSRSLTDHGWEVHVVTQLEGADLPRQEVLAGGETVWRFPSALSLRGQGVSLGYWRHLRSLPGPAQVLHLHNYHALATLGALLATGRAGSRHAEAAEASSRRGGVGWPGAPRRVLTPHYLGVGAGRGEAALHAGYRRLAAAELRAVDAVVAVSAGEADALIADFGLDSRRVHVIPNGVDVEMLRHAVPHPRPGRLVLVAGRLLAYKQPDLVIAAVHLLPPDVHLVVAGSGELEPNLRRLAYLLELGDRVRFVGSVPPAELARWYAAADVVVSMSERECFGLTLAEGLAAGAGIVASDIRAHRDVFALSGYTEPNLVPVRVTPQRLADAIGAALAAGRRPVATTPVPAWDQAGALMAELYSALAAGTVPAAGTASMA